MRRRWQPGSSNDSESSALGRNHGVANPSAVCDEVGDVRLSGMADEGVGRPAFDNETQKPYVTVSDNDEHGASEEDDRCSDSPVSSEEDESSSDSDDSDVRFDSNNSLSCDAVRTGPRLDGSAILPSGGAVPVPALQSPGVINYGNINLNKSSGVHIGNKTVFHGNVTIQQYLVKQTNDSLEVNVGQLAITDGVDPGTAGSNAQKRSGLELNNGSFRIGVSSVAASKGSGLLWRHLLGRKPGPATLAAWIAFGMGCMVVVAVAAALVYFLRSKEQPGATSTADADLETEEIGNSYKSPAKQQNRTILDRRRLVVVPRREWVAQPPKSTTSLKHPVEYVIISQTSTDPCTTQAECTLTVRYLQVFHVEGRKWMDIAYNFMVAGDGQAYEGRGWDVVGAHTTAGFNGISIGISFVGTFADVLPPPVQVKAFRLLVEEGVKLGKISADYKLIADRQVSHSENPGQALYEELQKWEHWTANV